MVRGSDGLISLIFGDMERSDQGHLLKNDFYVRDSARCSYTTIIRTHSTHRWRMGWGDHFDFRAAVAKI